MASKKTLLALALSVSLTASLQLMVAQTPAVASNSDGRLTVVLATDGTLHSWGRNYDNTLQTEPTLVDVGGFTGSFVAVSTGNNHALAIDSNGKVYAWGSNDMGQLGQGDTVDLSVPTEVKTEVDGVITSLSGKRVVAVAAGDDFSLALDSDGNLHSWGTNGDYQLGIGDQAISQRKVATAVAAPQGVTFSAVAAGRYHAAAISTDGNIYTWGYYGYMGVDAGDSEVFDRPTRVEYFDGINITKIATSYDHTMVLSDEGEIYVFGDNNSNLSWEEDAKLGRGIRVDSDRPGPVAETILHAGGPFPRRNDEGELIVKFTDIAVVGSASAALDEKGQLYLWGVVNYESFLFDNDGQTLSAFDDEGGVVISTPWLVRTSNENMGSFDYTIWEPAISFTSIEIGQGFLYGVTEAGELLSWGFPDPDNVSGVSLGLGPTVRFSSIATQVTGSLGGKTLSPDLFGVNALVPLLEEQPASQPGYNGPIVRSIGGSAGMLETGVGESVELEIDNPSNLSRVLIGGIEAELTSGPDGKVTILIPEGVPLGLNDIVIISDAGRLIVQDAIYIKSLALSDEAAASKCEGQTPKAWTKRTGSNEAKLYIKCGEVGTSYRVEVQRDGSGSFETLITRTLSSELDDRQVFNDLGRYFVRTLDIGEKLRVRIYAGEELMWQVVYNQDLWS